jgi:hypothetical protein
MLAPAIGPAAVEAKGGDAESAPADARKSCTLPSRALAN